MSALVYLVKFGECVIDRQKKSQGGRKRAGIENELSLLHGISRSVIAQQEQEAG